MKIKLFNNWTRTIKTGCPSEVPCSLREDKKSYKKFKNVTSEVSQGMASEHTTLMY